MDAFSAASSPYRVLGNVCCVKFLPASDIQITQVHRYAARSHGRSASNLEVSCPKPGFRSSLPCWS